MQFLLPLLKSNRNRKADNMTLILGRPLVSGTKEYFHATSDSRKELEQIATILHLPIIAGQPGNPVHINIPERKRSLLIAAGAVHDHEDFGSI